MAQRRPSRAAILLAAVLMLTGQVPVSNATSASVAPQASEPLLASQQVPPIPESAALTAPSDTGAWGPIMDWGVQAKHMVMLSTGRVLVWSTGDNARVWDPITGTFTLSPATFGDLHCAGQTALADGRIIVVGGQAGSPHDGTNITALFDPSTETWTRGQDMTDLRWYATATTLPDGRVLATSGDAPGGSRSTVPEVYDPATDTWTRLTTAPRSQGLYPFMFVLPDGRVFEAGSKNATALLSMTGSPSWSAGPTSAYSTAGYSESAVTYQPGKILRAGGGDPAQAATSLIDMTQGSPTWRAGDLMEYPRRRMNLTLLADGTVMAVGGTRAADDVTQAVLPGEIWDPTTEQWTTVAAMDEARMYHSTAVLLPDGRVLTGGGEGAGRLHAQIYSPPYLFRGARPTISSAPAAAGYGSSYTVATPDASAIASVALIRPSAVTHALDMDQRYVPLTYSVNGGSLTVSAPADANLAPPGFYMLVLKNNEGVPSVANWIRIGSEGSIQPGAVVGRVTDAASAAPVANATVSSSAGTDVSDADGRYRLPNVPAGELRVTTSAAGYANDSRVVTVAAGTETVLDIGLVVPGDVTGRVTDAATGDGIAGAAVGYPGGSTVTDAGGAYSVNGLPAGSRTLTFGATGYTSAERTVIVPAGASVTQDVALDPISTFIAGEVRSATSGDPLSSATVNVSPGALSATTDAFGRYRIDAPPGTYTVTASAVGHTSSSGSVLVTAGSYTTLDFSLSPTPSVPQTVTVAPVADTYVNSGSPTTSRATSTTLWSRDGSADQNSYLRFTVSGVGSASRAILRLYGSDASPAGGYLHRVADNGWSDGMLWASQPTRGALISSLGPVSAGAYREFDVSSYVTGDGTYSFAIIGASNDVARFHSREGANDPQLVITPTGGGGSTQPVAAFSVSPSSGPAPLAVTVSDSSTGSPSAWSWDFGDGSTDTGAAPAAHTYAAAGIYTITLTVSGEGGSSATTRTVTVSSPPPPGGGSRIKDITFDAGLLDPVHGVDSTSGPVTLETAMPLAGSASASIAQAKAYLQEGFSPTDDLYVRFAVRLRSLSSGSPRIMMISKGGTTGANLSLLSNGRLRLRVGSTTVGVDSTPLVVGTTYYVGLHQRRGSGANAVVEAFVSTSATLGTPFASTASGKLTSPADRIRFGATNSLPVNLLLDEVLLDTSSMPMASVESGSMRAGLSVGPGALIAEDHQH